jgi:hypothetical protein
VTVWVQCDCSFARTTAPLGNQHTAPQHSAAYHELHLRYGCLCGTSDHAPLEGGALTTSPPVGLPFQDGKTRLHTAASKGRTEVVGLLLGAGAAVDAADKVRPTPAARGVWGGSPCIWQRRASGQGLSEWMTDWKRGTTLRKGRGRGCNQGRHQFRKWGRMGSKQQQD